MRNSRATLPDTVEGMDLRAIFMGLAFAADVELCLHLGPHHRGLRAAALWASLALRFLISGLLGVAIAKALGPKLEA